MNAAKGRRVSGVEVRVHRPGPEIGDFIQAGYEILGSDPHWVPPLELMLHERLHPDKDPFHRHAEVALFTAWKHGRLVGRTSATVDRNWLATGRDQTGHFGYFDTVDDVEVAQALLGAAEEWLRARGMQRMHGPCRFRPTTTWGC